MIPARLSHSPFNVKVARSVTSPSGPPGAEEHGPYGEGDNCWEQVHLSSLDSNGRRRGAPPRVVSDDRRTGGTRQAQEAFRLVSRPPNNDLLTHEATCGSLEHAAGLLAVYVS